MKSGWMKKIIKKDDNEEENFKIEQNINEDQNSANLKNEIMGNNQNKPNFSSERPSVLPFWMVNPRITVLVFPATPPT